MLNPATLSLRKKDYDYTTTAGYFITIRFVYPCFQRETLESIILKTLSDFASRSPAFIVDCWTLIPDHIHLIFILDNSLGIGKALSVGSIVRAIKARVTHNLHQQGDLGFQWQSNYYDRIIRNEFELDKFRKYIFHNPLVTQLKEETSGH